MAEREMRAECAWKFGEQGQKAKTAEETCKDHERRISLLEKWQNRSIGYSAVVAALLGAAWQYFLKG